jgi:hypothetical protein
LNSTGMDVRNRTTACRLDPISHAVLPVRHIQGA